jgi:diaminopimelate epimerase
MNLEFYKYHGAGNDFIMIDCRDSTESMFTTEIVHSLCDRHFGIGADGLILLLKSNGNDFRMKYFNSDGKEGTMCGNGGRCITAFARDLGLISDKAEFTGIDGLHHSLILENGLIRLRMKDVTEVSRLGDGYLMDTGSTHFVVFRDNTDETDVFGEGRRTRYQQRFGIAGTNVNFVQKLTENSFRIRTYERGVEDETLACGTGAVASAISSYIENGTDKTSYLVQARGGSLSVSFTPKNDGSFTDVWLEGPAEFVFRGKITVKS